MKNLEAFILHVLCTVPFDVSLNELIARLERNYRVLEVILLDGLLCILQEVRDSLNA